jgi:hypothetical protein
MLGKRVSLVRRLEDASLGNPDEVTPWRNAPVLKPGESIASIVTRLAPFGLVTVEQLLTLGLLTQSKSVAGLPNNQVALKTLAAIGDINLEDLLSQAWTSTKRGFVMFGREMPEDWLRPIKRRLAPGVLSADGDTPYARSLWQLEIFSCDLETGEFLINRCCNCRHYLQWKKVSRLTHCAGCEFDLRDSEVRAVPEDDLEAARAFRKYLFGEIDLPSPFKEMDDLCIFKAMEWFAYFTDLRVGKHLRPAPYNAVRGFPALQKWPKSFDLVVEAFLRDFADPISGASMTAKVALLSDLMIAIGRAGTRELHDVLLARAIHILGETTISTRRVNDILSKPRRSLFQRGRHAQAGAGFFRDFMRSSQSWTGASPPSTKTKSS